MTDADRRKLASILGMLGSAHAGERAAAALQAEAFRRKHGLTWGGVLGETPPRVEVSDPEPEPAPPPPRPASRPPFQYAPWTAPELHPWQAPKRDRAVPIGVATAGVLSAAVLLLIALGF